jgi:hypothetical protein
MVAGFASGVKPLIRARQLVCKDSRDG